MSPYYAALAITIFGGCAFVIFLSVKVHLDERKGVGAERTTDAAGSV